MEYILWLKILVFKQVQLWIYLLIHLTPDWICLLLLGKHHVLVALQYGFQKVLPTDNASSKLTNSILKV